jgi:hypothetical protein
MASRLDITRARTDQWSSLSRIIDPRLSSNRLAIGGALTAAAAVGLSRLVGLDTALGPVSASIAVFLAWAIARELDPDHPASAAIAIPIALLLLVSLGPASLVVSTGVLLGARMTAGTVGTPLCLLDIIGIVALSALLGASLLGVVGFAAMMIGVFMDEPHFKRAVAIAAAGTTAFIAVALNSGTAWAWMMPDAAGWVALVVAAGGSLLVVPAASPMASTDRHTGIVRRERITVARVSVGLMVVAGFILAGGTGIAALAATAIAALAGTAIREIGGVLSRSMSARGVEPST